MQLRKATPADGTLLTAFLSRITGKIFDEMKLQEEIADDTQYIVLHKEHIIAAYTLKPLGDKVLKLERLCIHPSLQDKDFDRQLIEKCKQQAAKAGMPLYAEFPLRDEEQTALFQACGFKQTATYNDKETVVAVYAYLPEVN